MKKRLHITINLLGLIDADTELQEIDQIVTSIADEAGDAFKDEANAVTTHVTYDLEHSLLDDHGHPMGSVRTEVSDA
jgi:hypothetical protein